MANLSNINNKLIVTDGGNLLVNATANLATYGGITIDNFSDPSIAMKTTGTSGWLWTQYITSTGTNNFSMGVNQSLPYWCVKAGAGMDSPHLVVDSSGNVGIGNINPSDYSADANNLVVGSLTGNNGITILSTSSSGYGSLYFADSTTGNKVYSGYIRYQQNQSNMTFGTNEVERMRIDVNGNVGIGVAPWVSTLPNTVIDINPVASIWGYANSAYLNANAYYNNGWLYKSTASAGVLQVDGNILRFRAAASGTADAGIAFDVPFIVDSTGNVGIGTISPGRKLTVTGDVSGDANNLLLSNENDTDGDSASIGFSMLSNNTYVKSGIFFERTTTQGRGSLHLAVNNEVNGNNVTKTDAKLTINNSGKVGIGTTNPSEILHINGGGSGPEIRLQGTWGSHYIRAYNDNWNFLVGGTVQAINIKNNGNISMGTSNNGSKLNVGGTIAAATNDLSSGMFVPRSLGVTYGGSTFTYTFNPVTLFGMGFRGGQVLFECTGWQMAMNNGYIMWRNAGGGDPIGTNGSVQYVQTAYVNGGQSGSNTIAVSLTSGTNDITITFTGWHGNSHGFMCRITTNYS